MPKFPTLKRYKKLFFKKIFFIFDFFVMHSTCTSMFARPKILVPGVIRFFETSPLKFFVKNVAIFNKILKMYQRSPDSSFSKKFWAKI